ncbi:MAG: pyridoxal phosphate-dependent aminotransferase [Deltaproteobacteria bacterium]|nr:pyridoxal phosphate-dependent aminotransferase [Deltaproteobacteria bacterium]
MPTFVPSQRGQTAPASPIRRLTPYADDAKRRGVQVLHLNIGQPDIATPRAMIQAYHDFDDKVLAYGASEGSLRYRWARAGYYTGLGLASGGAPIDPEQIIATVGGSEALLFAIGATCDAGDEVLVTEPYYPNYWGYAHLLSVSVRAITTTADNGFRTSAEQVAAAIGPRTRVVLLSTPGNPTGTVYSAAELRAIASVCRERGVYIISDEVYRDFVYDHEILQGRLTAPSLLAEPGFADNAILVDSVSKRYSACGARVGCVVTRNAELRAAMLKFAQCRLSPPVVDMLAAEAALQTPPAELALNINEYHRRRDALVAGLRAIPGVHAATPEGAFYLMVELPVDDAEKFCIFLLQDFALDGHTVMLAPGDGFYANAELGRRQVRAAYVLEVPKLQQACQVLAAALQVYPGRLRSAV